MQESNDDVYDEMAEEIYEEEEEEVEEEYEEEEYGDDDWYWDENPDYYDDDSYEDEYWVSSKEMIHGDLPKGTSLMHYPRNQFPFAFCTHYFLVSSYIRLILN